MNPSMHHDTHAPGHPGIASITLRLSPQAGLRNGQAEKPAQVRVQDHQHDARALITHTGDEQARLLVLHSGSASLEACGTHLELSSRRAAWVPAHCDYRMHCRSDSRLQVLQVAAPAATLPAQLRSVETTSLLLALLQEVRSVGHRLDDQARHAAIVDLLLSEIPRMRCFDSETRMPTDPRLSRVCEAILADPGDERHIDDWASAIGMGRRTFTRLCREQLGMGLVAWRQQIRIKAAASRLATGAPIARVANEMGYSNPSSFSSTFRRVLGVQPSQYMHQR